jgi:putative ABC transport system substrate-binding protein
VTRRRDFIAGLGSAAAWPVVARAQQSDRMRNIGLLLSAASDDPEFQVWVGAFLQGLALLGRTLGGNLRIDTRWAGTNAADIRKHAAELAALEPEVILAHGTSTVTPLLQVTRTVPVVFVSTTDPVGAGLVNSFTRPGGNATGFMAFEYSLSAKWLELLKRIMPDVMRVAVLRESSQGSGTNYFAVIQAMAPLLKVEVSPVNASDVDDIERATTAFASAPNGGLVVTPSHQAGSNQVQPRQGFLILSSFIRGRCPIAQSGGDHGTCLQRGRNRNGHNLAWARAGRRLRRPGG